MSFHEGDPVMHWTYGFGQIVSLEERVISGLKTLYYSVQVQDLTVWVPSDSKINSRLRPPTPVVSFKKLLTILSGKGESLPIDRYERRTRLLELAKDGSTAALCNTIRALVTFRKKQALNDSDESLLKQSQNTLLGEWEFVLGVTHAQAEIDLQRLLGSEPAQKEAVV